MLEHVEGRRQGQRHQAGGGQQKTRGCPGINALKLLFSSLTLQIVAVPEKTSNLLLIFLCQAGSLPSSKDFNN